MLLARSLRRKVFVTAVAAVLFVWLLEATMFDSRYARLPLRLIEPAYDSAASPSPGARLAFTSTAYCKGQVTTSGVNAQRGAVAADPSLLPLGSLVQLDFEDNRYDGMYTVLDTGPEIQGREIDLYMWSCYEALAFGRRPVRMTVLRIGWNPHATTRRFIDRLFNKTDDDAGLPEPDPPPGTPQPPAQ